MKFRLNYFQFSTEASKKCGEILGNYRCHVFNNKGDLKSFLKDKLQSKEISLSQIRIEEMYKLDELKVEFSYTPLNGPDCCFSSNLTDTLKEYNKIKKKFDNGKVKCLGEICFLKKVEDFE